MKKLPAQVTAERKSRPNKQKLPAVKGSSQGIGKHALCDDAGDGQALVKRRKLGNGEKVSFRCAGALH